MFSSGSWQTTFRSITTTFLTWVWKTCVVKHDFRRKANMRLCVRSWVGNVLLFLTTAKYEIFAWFRFPVSSLSLAIAGLLTVMERRLRATSGSQLELRCSNHVTYTMWHTSLSTTIYNTHPPDQVLYLSRDKLPIIPFARTAAAVVLPVASAPPPPQHPPVGSSTLFAHRSHHSCVIIWGRD